MSGLPSDGVADHFEHFFVATIGNGRVVGSAGVEIYEKAALVRSVAVAPDRQHAGLGARLVARVLDFAATLGVADAYLLTRDAADYFTRLGFAPIAREQVPAAVRASVEFTTSCPATASAMHRVLSVDLPQLIRPAEARDLPALLSLMDELIITHSPSAEHRARAAEDYAQVFTEIDRDPKLRLFVVEVDGRVAGSAMLVIVPNLSHRASPWAIIENVIVAADFRGRGLGRTLLTHGVRAARAAGCYKVMLTSNFVREQAHALYDTLGFQRHAWGYRIDF